MKRFLVAITAAASLLSACSISIESKPSEEPSKTTESAAPEDYTQLSEEEYAALVRENAPGLVGVPTADIIDVSESTCNAFDRGVSLDRIIEIGLSTGLDSESVGTLVGGAVAWKCPEYASLLKQPVL